MKCDILLAGVGGQGVLSIAAIIGSAALRRGLQVKQSETHGMSQRGGAVVANLRIADGDIHSDLIPRGRADLILSMEPLESLRYLEYLAPEGAVVTSADPVKNFPDYPDEEKVLADVRSLPRAVLVEAHRLAREAGSAYAVNMVMVGAASSLLPVTDDELEERIRDHFARKGEKIVEINLKAFRAGREAGTWVAS